MEENKLSITTPRPAEIVAFGQESAKQLVQLVRQNNWMVKIPGTQTEYLRFEAWQTLARFFGYTVRTSSTEFVKYGEREGFNATAEILDANGLVIGGAEACCLNDEDNWRTENHPNRYGKDVPGRELFTLKSMAQTRACARALRQILSWVVVLAGYSPTPIEDMGSVPANTTSAVPGEVRMASQPQKDAIKRMKSLNRIPADVDEEKLTLEEARVIIGNAYDNKPKA